MQVMWVSGPTGQVKTVSITARKVLIGTCLMSLALVTMGVLLYFMGFKIAIEHRPELARSLGGVTTLAEQQRMETVYREQLAKLQTTLEATGQDIQHLITLKNRFMEIATPATIRKSKQNNDGKGGPLLLLPSKKSKFNYNHPLAESIEFATNEFSEFQSVVSEMRQDWARQLNWLKTLPTGIPLEGKYRIASGFGIRSDPFTRKMARHEGLDFTALKGTPIVATADGVVTRSEWEKTYGHIVEISHAEGFASRYAHCNKRHVIVGQQVKRGDRIADVGSTGRSTGPHLHYEISRFGKILNPAKIIPLKKRIHSKNFKS
tara:strand:+ start:874 stop:1830 length:957 start_codon:yes stop_codon:yes gene_type:complete